MVQNPVEVALILLQVIVLTLPVVAIFFQAMLSFYGESEPQDEKYSKVLKILMRRRFLLVFATFLGLYIALGAIIFYLSTVIGLPWELDLAILAILVGVFFLSILIAVILIDAESVFHEKRDFR